MIAQRFGTSPGAVAEAVGVGNDANPQCTFTVSSAGGPRVVVIADVDSGPQPYFRLERTAVEASQQFGTVRLYAPPQQIPGIGLDADWFPAGNYLMSTDGVRLITVTVHWRRVSQATQIALAEAVMRHYLRHSPHAGATGYPSG